TIAAGCVSKRKSTDPQISPFQGPAKSTPLDPNLFPWFPCSKDPAPDAPIDYTELWKAVSIAKESDKGKMSQHCSSRGTEAYDGIFYLLGIDINQVMPPGN